MSQTIPYWRLSSFYFFYFASLGALIPYWGLYLRHQGYTPGDIGELMAILMGTRIVSPYLWSWVADHTGRSMLVIRFTAICATLAFAGVFISSSFWWLALVMVVFSFFWNAELPQFEANTMNFLGQNTHRYSFIRIWGSVGFILTVIILGVLLDKLSIVLVPVAILLLFSFIAISSFTVVDKPGQQSSEHGSIMQILKQPVVIALMLVCMLGQMSHGPYYAFYSIYLSLHGYSSTDIGWLWALGVIAELVLFLSMHRLMRSYGLWRLMMIAMALAALRWLLIAAFVELVAVIIFAQLLHAASFGLYHVVSVELFHRFFRGRYQGRGQALYSSVSFGLGGAIGSYASGKIWHSISPEMIYIAAAVAAALASLVAYKFMREDPQSF